MVAWTLVSTIGQILVEYGGQGLYDSNDGQNVPNSMHVLLLLCLVQLQWILRLTMVLWCVVSTFIKSNFPDWSFGAILIANSQKIIQTNNRWTNQTLKSNHGQQQTNRTINPSKLTNTNTITKHTKLRILFKNHAEIQKLQRDSQNYMENIDQKSISVL